LLKQIGLYIDSSCRYFHFSRAKCVIGFSATRCIWEHVLLLSLASLIEAEPYMGCTRHSLTKSPLLTVQVKYVSCYTMKNTYSLQAKGEREGSRPQPATASNEIARSKSLSLRCTCNHSVSFPSYPSRGPSTSPRVLILCII